MAGAVRGISGVASGPEPDGRRSFRSLKRLEIPGGVPDSFGDATGLPLGAVTRHCRLYGKPHARRDAASGHRRGHKAAAQGLVAGNQGRATPRGERGYAETTTSSRTFSTTLGASNHSSTGSVNRFVRRALAARSSCCWQMAAHIRESPVAVRRRCAHTGWRCTISLHPL